MLQLEASLRRGALSCDWDPLARLAARRAAASRAASAVLPPVVTPAPAPLEAQLSTPLADASAPGTPNTLATEPGRLHAMLRPCGSGLHHPYMLICTRE